MTLRSYDRIYLGGRWVPSAGTDTIEVVSPRTEEVVATVPHAGADDVDAAVAAARAAFDRGPWSRLDPAERIERLRPFAERYAERTDELAALVTEEIGSPITFSQLAQSTAPSMMIGSFLDLAARHPWEERRTTIMGGTSVVRRLPVGVVAAIVPWNVPQVVLVAKLVPALLAGCSVVVKPSPESPLDAFFLAEVLDAAHLPEGVVSVLPAGRRWVSTSCATPASTRWRSPAAPPPGAASPSCAGPASPVWPSSWAASRPPSCSTTPIRRRRPRACGSPRS